jgi:VanZ family protein
MSGSAPARRLLWYGPALAWAVFLLWLGSATLDVPYEPYPFIPLDKVAHFGLYGILGVLAVFGWRMAGRWPHVTLPLGLALAVGALDELRQRSVATRSADVLDFVADLIAIVLAFVVLIRWWKPEEVE